MNRKNEEDKKINISISLHPDIKDLIEKYSKKNELKRSKLIENIIREYFKKESNDE